MDGGRLNVWREVYELAGELGVEPGPFTLHELYTMIWGKRRAVRDETALIVATTLNINRRKHAAPIKAADLNPYRERRRPAAEPEVGIEALKVFLPGGGT